MDNSYYTGKAAKPKKDLWKDLPDKIEFNKETGYVAQQGLIDAVNVALILNRPLLLTGEPGTGKSTLAKSLAYELDCKELELKVEIKSTTTAKDLFYTFDHIGWFNTRDNDNNQIHARNFLTLTGLGKAIFDAAKELPEKVIPPDYKRSSQLRSVVLIDEIDKAPRDVPNDLLNEIENFHFRVSEIDNVKIEAEKKYCPIIIITSNSESSLPDAFLRRCVFYNIELPDDETLKKILVSRLGGDIKEDDLFLKDAIGLMHEMRKHKDFEKKPGVSELIDFLAVLRPEIKLNHSLKTNLELVRKNMSCLIKNQVSQKTKDDVFSRWQKRHS